MEHSFEEFYTYYQKARERWGFASFDEAYEDADLLLLESRVSEGQTAQLCANYSEKSVKFIINENNTAKEIWREEFDSVNELERAWFILDAKTIQQEFSYEIDMLFGDYIDD
ncbi:MAG: hypothetical protein Q4E22_06150 [Coriobacteriia bacterium]|nr:hypothetical protein [Coriobacteriia bacterium]